MGALAQPQIGRYRLYDKIAAGGMATVHFGRLLGSAGFSRTVAIKRLHPHLAGDAEFRSTLIDEARMAARIHHPNVVPTLDVVTSDGELLVVMEYVRGESLSRLLKFVTSHGQLVPLPVTSAIALGALQGLHAAHEATSDHGAPLGIVHRDVSPQNILVGVDGVARIIDFGVAKAAGRLSTTREGVVKGKMAYMSPEQLESREVSRTSDVYAMAVVIWETLAGKRLFAGESDGAVFGKVLAGAKEPPSRHAPGVPEALDAIVMKGLATDPTHRFASAKEMAECFVRVVPPALPMDVGAWVEQVARDGLAERAAVLAEIESGSGMAPSMHGVARETGAGIDDVPPTVPESVAETVVLRGARPSDDGAPTAAAESSSLSVETPRKTAARTRRGRRVAVGLGAAGLLAAAGVAGLAWRGGAWSTHAVPGAEPAALGPSASPSPTSPPAATTLPPPPPTASTPAIASATPSASAARAPKATVTATAPPRSPPTKKPEDTVKSSGF